MIAGGLEVGGFLVAHMAILKRQVVGFVVVFLATFLGFQSGVETPHSSKPLQHTRAISGGWSHNVEIARRSGHPFRAIEVTP